MGRSPCCSKVGLQRGPWSAMEDNLLTDYIQKHGEGQWRSLPSKAGLLRCGKSCRLRWMNYLRPGIKRGNITPDEEDLIARLHSLLGNRWSLIAGRLPGRTDNEIKNYWNTHLLKKLRSSGFEPKVSPKCSTKCPKEETKAAPKRRKYSTKCAKGIPQNAGTERKTQKCWTKCCQDKTQSDAPDDGNAKNTGSSGTTTLHIPKPIRISCAFSRTNSLDSLMSVASSGDDVEEDYLWPLLELNHTNYGGCDQFSGEIQDFLSFYDFPVDGSDSSGAPKVLQKVYDEYLQLL